MRSENGTCRFRAAAGLSGLATAVVSLALVGVLAPVGAGARDGSPPGGGASGQAAAYPAGTATPAEECGVCHRAIYREFQMGFGSDLAFRSMVYGAGGRPLALPRSVSTSATAHAAAGVDPWPVHARDVEEAGRACNVCHFPEAFDIPETDTVEIAKPRPRASGFERGGLTCASCHLTPDGRIRGPYEAQAPHPVVRDERMQTAAMCAFCHAMGRRVVGKQTQTFLEWRDDFAKPGLGRQQCQDCHMPRTVRKLAEDSDAPERAVGRHLWTGGHSTQRLRAALNVVIVRSEDKGSAVEFHVINIGAGHSVPTGSNRRAVYLRAEAVGPGGSILARREWMFAPWYSGRPDDARFLEEDKARPDAGSAMQADRQGPHEPPVRAGEERVLVWPLTGARSATLVRARLVYDLNRYNDPTSAADQTEIYRTSLVLARPRGR